MVECVEIIDSVEIVQSIITREWGINWRNSYEQSKKCVRHAMEIYFREHE